MVDTNPVKRIRSLKVRKTLARPRTQKGQYKKLVVDNADLLRAQRDTSRVQKIISILSKQIEPSYCQRPRNYWLIQIHKKPNSKYFKLFCQLYKYLLGLKDKRDNPIDSLIHDYLECIYVYYKEYRRMPKLDQLRPYESNQVLFTEWIYEWEQERDERYWIDKKGAELENISEEAAKILNGKSEIIADNIDITETKRG